MAVSVWWKRAKRYNAASAFRWVGRVEELTSSVEMVNVPENIPFGVGIKSEGGTPLVAAEDAA